MDPNATYDAMMQALMDGDTEEAQEHARNLLEWTYRGGFFPAREHWERVSRNVLDF